MAVEGRDAGDDAGPGHVMKARYTPAADRGRARVEETDRDALEASEGLRGTPVVCAPLHSMIGADRRGRASVAGATPVVYVMTDGAALPGAFSRLVGDLRGAGLLDGWITVRAGVRRRARGRHRLDGPAGRREVLDADVIVVADGPGNLGTDTTWGVSALGQRPRAERRRRRSAAGRSPRCA